MRRPARQEHDDQPVQSAAMDGVAGGAHDGDDFLDGRWVCWERIPLLRGGRPAWNAGRVAGERRRPAASSSNSDLTPPRESETHRACSPTRAVRPPPERGVYTEPLPRPGATSIRAAGECSSALSMRRRAPGVPRRMERDCRRATAAFHGCRSTVWPNCAPADAWVLSAVSVSGAPGESAQPAKAKARPAGVVGRSDARKAMDRGLPCLVRSL
jgi:hypothetical protein